MLGRTARLPFDHLVAELAAFPLGSEAALTNPVTVLDPGMSDAATKKLWRAAERVLLGAAPGLSLDELTALRDETWFGGDAIGCRTLERHLQRAAEWPLQAFRNARRGGPLTDSPEAADARRRWMWLTLALPADLLTVLSGRHPFAGPGPLCPPVRELLSRSFAETHLHVGAAIGFGEVWSLIVNRMAHADLAGRSLGAPGAVLDEGGSIPGWLARASVARYLLGSYVASGHPGPFERFLSDPGVVRRARRSTGAANWSLILKSLHELSTGAVPPGRTGDVALPGAYGALVRAPRPERLREIEEIRRLDPLEPLFGSHDESSTEQRYVVALCRHLRNTEDPLASRLFWQTVRVRTVLYRHLTQRPLTPGLPYFIRFYKRMSAVRGELPPLLQVSSAGVTSGRVEGLRSLEVRTSPATGPGELLSWVDAARKEAKKSAGAEVGLVLHFLKDRAGAHGAGFPRAHAAGTNADPSREVNPTGYRYARYFAGQRQAALILGDFLHRLPDCQQTVRGLDICADELAVPTWVLAPLVRHVRAAAGAGAEFVRRCWGDVLRPLRITAHAGEDFAHLLTGLRHVYEAMQLLDMGEGDRIGHGMALGVDPEAWARRAGRVAMPLEDRVWDLTWEWSWWARRGAGADGARLAYLAGEIERLSRRWFGAPVTALDMEQLMAGLSDEDLLKAAGFPSGPAAWASDRQLVLMRRFLTDVPSFRRGRRTEWVEPVAEVDALMRIGTSLRSELARNGLAVEVNPTSNLLVGDMGDLSAHPLWRLAPPRPRPDLPPLTVTVGSDDPLVFNCRLPGEYQLLYDSLVLAGLTDMEAMHWLDQVRNNGLNRRFTVRECVVRRPWSDPDRPPRFLL
ncbi:amidohydrolase family protein [Actinoplanes sp. RD1]|uniref:hypothetical protein n=1 Tax=Actinoplanes sp. RD1 TaxID=3064538 RepID=UPI0027405DDB|nr:hypothetical protein [Actinoplanes sp. RD1]